MYSKSSEVDILRIINDSLIESGGVLSLIGMRINPNLTLGLTLNHSDADDFDLQKAVKVIAKNISKLNVLLNLNKIENIDSNSVYLSFNFKSKYS